MLRKSKLLTACLVLFLSCSKGPSDEFVKRVQQPTTNQLDRIKPGLEKGFVLQPPAYTVKSKSHNSAYYIVTRLQGPGVSAFAAWCISGEPTAESGIVLSANNVAAEFSQWPKGSETKADAWITDPDCSNLLDYANGKNK